MKRASLLIIALLLFSFLLAPAVKAESPGPWWVKTYGGSDDDVATAVAVAENGDVIVAGETYSFGAGRSDVWVLRLDANGNVKWQKTYGGSDDDVATAVAVAENGDVIVAGGTWSFGAGWTDFWVLRLDESGNVKWQKTYSGSDWDHANAVAIAPNGDVIVAGVTESFGAGNTDVWVLRLDANGNVKWQKTYGGSRFDKANAVALAPNGDVIVAGYTDSFGAGNDDVWVLRLDENGNVKWQKTYGVDYWDDGASTVAIAENGDIIVAGNIYSSDVWVLRLDENGKVKWQKVYGGGKSYHAYAIAIAENGDIIVAGRDLLRLSPDGELRWAVDLEGKDVKVLPDGTAVLAGGYNDDFLVARFNVDEVPNYSGWRGWEEKSLKVHDSDALVESTHAEVKTSNAVIHNTDAEIQNTNAQVETLWSLVDSAKSEVQKASSTIDSYRSQGIILTSAEELLSKAQQAFQQGDYINAYTYASQAIDKAEEIKDWHDKALPEAKDARELASRAGLEVSPLEEVFNSGDYEKAYQMALDAQKAAQAIMDAQGFLSPLGDAKAAFEKGDYVIAYKLAVEAKEKRDTYQKLFALGVFIIIGIVSVSAYRVHERKERERRVKRARELMKKAEKASLLEAIKLARKALELAGSDAIIKSKAEEIISRGEKEFNTILNKGDELLADKECGEAIKTYESARALAEALGKTDVLDSKIQTAKNLLEKGRKAERFERLMAELNSAIARRDYETVGNILAEAQTLARELGRESTVNSVLDDLKTRFENVMERARDAELSGDYTSALTLYTEALSLARLLDYDTSEIEEAVKSIESRRREELLKKSVKVDVPTEMPHKVETEVSIIVTNRFSEDLSLTIDLSENVDYFELSEEKVNFPRVKPGRTIGESITVKPRFMGDFDFTIKVESDKGSFRKVVPVKVTKTARMGAAAVTPSALGRTPILNPVEALQELYSDFQYVGEGGFARVYRAKRKDGKIVAVKIPKTLDPAIGRAFVREITNWLHLKHPNIVELYDVNVLPVPYLEMEYCEGSLARLQKPLPVEEASLIVFNIAEGLKYAHSKKIVHRDLKPSNVLLKNGLPKISDWGLSKVLEDSMSATTTASFTPHYAAPEQIDKKYGHTDERTDIYQLGVIFYELVTGKLPFESSLSQVMMGVLRDDPVPPSEINPATKEVEPIIMKMLAKRKEERYKSVGELQRDLAGVLNMTYSESLKESKTLGDRRRATYYLTELLLINLKTNNAGEAYKYASDLVFYVKGELKEEVQKLAEQVKFRLEEGVDIPQELIEKAEIVVHKIRVGFEKV